MTINQYFENKKREKIKKARKLQETWEEIRSSIKFIEENYDWIMGKNEEWEMHQHQGEKITRLDNRNKSTNFPNVIASQGKLRPGGKTLLYRQEMMKPKQDIVEEFPTEIAEIGVRKTTKESISDKTEQVKHVEQVSKIVVVVSDKVEKIDEIDDRKQLSLMKNLEKIERRKKKITEGENFEEKNVIKSEKNAQSEVRKLMRNFQKEAETEGEELKEEKSIDRLKLKFEKKKKEEKSDLIDLIGKTKKTESEMEIGSCARLEIRRKDAVMIKSSLCISPKGKVIKRKINFNSKLTRTLNSEKITNFVKLFESEGSECLLIEGASPNISKTGYKLELNKSNLCSQSNDGKLDTFGTVCKSRSDWIRSGDAGQSGQSELDYQKLEKKKKINHKGAESKQNCS